MSNRTPFEKRVAQVVRNFPNIHENEVVPVSVIIYVHRGTGRITTWSPPKPCRLEGESLSLVDRVE